MSLYQAPLKDTQLLVEQALQKTGLASCPELEDFDAPLVAAILEEAGKFAAGELVPLNAVGDTVGCRLEGGKVSTPPGWKEACQKLCEAGWMGLELPAEHGGQAIPKFIAQPVNEMWLSANLAFVMFHALAQGGSELLLKFGTEQQKQRYLEPIITGRWTVAMALTEPNAGSDLGSLTTTAILQDDGRYLIKGQKIYITYGEHDLAENIVHLVLARTPEAPAGSRGISLFAVPKYGIGEDGTPGEPNDVLCTGIEHKTGLHGSPTCSLSYGEQDACFGELIGEENRGLAAMFVLMSEARLSCGMQGVGLGEMGFQRCKALQARIALLTPIFKAFATERGNLMAGTTIQIFGGMGFVEQTGVAQLMRDARITTIYEGTTGIQARDLVFRKIQGDSGLALEALLDKMDEDCKSFTQQGSGNGLNEELRRATEAMRTALPAITGTDSKVLTIDAGSVPLLEALSTLCCAWQLACTAATAHNRKAEHPEYYQNLIALADYYFAHSVPLIHAKLESFPKADHGVAEYQFEY